MKIDVMPNKAAPVNAPTAPRLQSGQGLRGVTEQRRWAAPMNHPTPNQVSWLLVDLCEKAGFSMAIRDNEHFQAVAVQGPDAFTDAVLAAEGITPEHNKQMRRDLNRLVAARFAQWEAESGTEQIAALEMPQPPPISDGSVHRTLDSLPMSRSRGGR